MRLKQCLIGVAIVAGMAPAMAEPQLAIEPAAVPPAVASAAPAVVTPFAVAVAVPAVPTVPAKPSITLQAKADLAQQTLTVSERGRVIAIWKISSGVADHATPRGVFQPEWTAKMWYSHKYDNAPMPHAVFFKDGAAIHATQATGALGRAASHGCVRLAPANAETFYKLVQKHGLARTRISVFGAPQYQQPVAVRQDQRHQQRWAGDRAPSGAANRSAGYASASIFGGLSYQPAYAITRIR